jgi:hypothetical protein
MKISGRPLLPTRVDQPLYVPRASDDRVGAAVRRGLNVLLLAGPGAGKTSTLHHLAYQAREAGGTWCYVDGRGADGLRDLVDRVRRELAVDTPPEEGPLAWLAKQGIRPPLPPAERTLTHLARELAGREQAVVAIDDPDRVVAHTLFGQLRDVAWQVPVTWVVAADESVEAELRRPPADAFFDVVERLGALDAGQVREILRRRGVPVRQARVVATLGQGTPVVEQTPRTVLERVRRIAVEQVSGDELATGEAELQRRLGAVSRAAGMLAAEIRSKGAVSASDPELQRRMGWTRARLTQVFKELESAGIARATEASDGRPGRPRRRYEVIEP